MMKQNKEIFETIIDLLLPYVNIEHRRELLIATFSEHKNLYHQIDFSGDNHKFSIHLVDLLLRFGKVNSRQEAITLLLEKIRGKTGLEDQEKIDEVLHRLGCKPSTVPLSDSIPDLSVGKSIAVSQSEEIFQHSDNAPVDKNTKYTSSKLYALLLLLVIIILLCIGVWYGSLSTKDADISAAWGIVSNIWLAVGNFSQTLSGWFFLIGLLAIIITGAAKREPIVKIARRLWSKLNG